MALHSSNRQSRHNRKFGDLASGLEVYRKAADLADEIGALTAGFPADIARISAATDLRLQKSDRLLTMPTLIGNFTDSRRHFIWEGAENHHVPV
jgi:hypothetical protein